MKDFREHYNLIYNNIKMTKTLSLEVSKRLEVHLESVECGYYISELKGNTLYTRKEIRDLRNNFK